MFAFWPFDFSCSGIGFIGLLLLMWFMAAIGQAAKTATNVAKEVMQNETAQEVGKGFLAAWLESFFK